MKNQMRPDDMLMFNGLVSLWNGYPEDMPLQEKFKHLISEAKKHWMVIHQPAQIQNTIMALGSVYKDESEEKFLAYTYLTGMLLRTQEYVQELISLDEDEVADRSDIMLKYHDPNDPEKQLMPLNWNDLWLKPIVFEEKKENPFENKEAVKAAKRLLVELEREDITITIQDSFGRKVLLNELEFLLKHAPKNVESVFSKPFFATEQLVGELKKDE